MSADDKLLLKLHEERAKAQKAFERWYRKAKRAFTEMEKARADLKRLTKRIQVREGELALNIAKKE